MGWEGEGNGGGSGRTNSMGAGNEVGRKRKRDEDRRMPQAVRSHLPVSVVTKKKEDVEAHVLGVWWRLLRA